MSDGAKNNRKFFKGKGIKEDKKEGIIYKTVNRFCTDKYIYLMPDVPHA